MRWSCYLTVVACLIVATMNFWSFNLLNTIYISSVKIERPKQSETQSITISFVGDILLARHVENLMKFEGFDYPFTGFSFSSSTYVFGNFESAIPEVHISTPIQSTKFSTPNWAIPPLAEAGFTHLSLANNHSFDYGISGYSNTAKVLTQNNLNFFGHQYNLTPNSTDFINIGTSTIAVTGINFLNTTLNKADIEYLKSLETISDYQIAYVHWGEEYNQVANPRQREQAKQLISTGFDLIIGHHPHVVQDIETIDGVVVVYSLGNYIFDQYFSEPVQTGLVAHVHFKENEANLELEPVTSLSSLSKPKRMIAQDQDIFLKELAVSSSADLLLAVTAGKIPLASFDEKVIIDDIKFTYVQ